MLIPLITMQPLVLMLGAVTAIVSVPINIHHRGPLQMRHILHRAVGAGDCHLKVVSDPRIVGVLMTHP